MDSVRGGLINVTSSSIGYLCHGGRNPMPGSGQLVHTNLAGMFHVHQQSGQL
jgi:hypothetical protein